MKVVALTLFVGMVLFFMIRLLIEFIGITDALILVGCFIVAYYLAKDL